MACWRSRRALEHLATEMQSPGPLFEAQISLPLPHHFARRKQGVRKVTCEGSYSRSNSISRLSVQPRKYNRRDCGLGIKEAQKNWSSESSTAHSEVNDLTAFSRHRSSHPHSLQPQYPCCSRVQVAGCSGTALARGWGTKRSHEEALPAASLLVSLADCCWPGRCMPIHQLQLTEGSIWKSGYILLISSSETSK